MSSGNACYASASAVAAQAAAAHRAISSAAVPQKEDQSKPNARKVHASHPKCLDMAWHCRRHHAFCAVFWPKSRVLYPRKKSNDVLATVIWGNVGTNVFLTLLSGSVLAGLGAFFFSTVVITLFGEIAPQAYFSRNALRMTARFLPFLIFWRAALFFVAKPTAILLDWWLGVEGIAYLRERDVHALVGRAAATGGDIGKLEATGVQNFLDLDDLPVTEEGEPIHAQSIISLPLASGRCVLPPFIPSPDDPFLQRVNASGKKW